MKRSALPHIRLFAYGTLLEAKTQRRVFGRVVERVPARLIGWRVVPRLVLGRYPGVVPEAGVTTTGAMLKINSAELARADAYEGTLYVRRRVAVRDGPRVVRCWMYAPAAAKRR
jgi:gamma-glutamylcyclotransferase (GGCT)/AIG2-like uncharacterized protein YtfP